MRFTNIWKYQRFVLFLWSMVLFSRPCGKQCCSVRWWWAGGLQQRHNSHPICSLLSVSYSFTAPISLFQHPWLQVYSVCMCTLAWLQMCNTMKVRVENILPESLRQQPTWLISWCYCWWSPLDFWCSDSHTHWSRHSFCARKQACYWNKDEWKHIYSWRVNTMKTIMKTIKAYFL